MPFWQRACARNLPVPYTKMAAKAAIFHVGVRSCQLGLAGSSLSSSSLAKRAATANRPSKPRMIGEMPIPRPVAAGGGACGGGGGGVSTAGKTQPVWPCAAATAPAAAAAEAVFAQTCCAEAWVPKTLTAINGLIGWIDAEVAALAIVGLTPRGAREAIERIQAAGAHIVGVTLTKSSAEASHYGYRLQHYGYKQVDDQRNEIVMISHQTEG